MSEYEKFMASDMDWDTFNYKKLSKLDSLVSYGRSDLDHARCQYIQDQISDVGEHFLIMVTKHAMVVKTLDMTYRQ